MRRGAFLESTQQTPPMSDPLPLDGPAVLEQLRAWGRALGFSQIGVAGIDLSSVEPRLAAWLNNGFHGEMDYMAAHGMKRARPAELVAGTLSVITARLDYLPRDDRARLAGDRVAPPRRPGGGGAVDLRPRPRLPQGAAPAPAQARRPARRGDRPVRPPGLHRFGAGARGRARGAQRHRLARQAHARARSRRRLDVLPRRDLRRRRPARDADRLRPLRQLQRVHRRLPDAGDRRPLRARRAPLHLVPDDRSQGRDPGRVPRRDRQSRLRLRRLPARLPVEQVREQRARSPTSTSARRSTRRGCSTSGPGAKTTSCARPRAARSAASASSAGSAISPSRSATRSRRAVIRRSSPR